MALKENIMTVSNIVKSLKSEGIIEDNEDQLTNILLDPLFLKILAINECLQNLKSYAKVYDINTLTNNDYEITPQGLIFSPSILKKLQEDAYQTPKTIGDYEQILVEIFRPENASLGLSILGLQNDANDSVGVFIKEIDSNGIAGSSGKLQEGDQIIAINGVRLQHVPHTEAIALLQNSKGPITLLIERKVKSTSPLSKSKNDATDQKKIGLTHLTQIHENSPSYSDTNVISSPLIESRSKALTAPERKVSLGSFSPIDVSPKDMVLDTEWAQLEQIILLNEGSGLGFGIVGGRSTGVVVKSILPGSVASVDGRLQNSDHILQIGDVNLRGMSSDQVANVLRHCGPQVKLVVAREINEIPATPSKDSSTNANTLYLPTKLLNEQLGMDILPSQIIAAKNTLPEEPVLNGQLPSTMTNGTKGLLKEEHIEKPAEGEEESITFERTLVKGSHGLGMTVAGYIGDEISGIFVKSIAQGSPADNDGNIKINDQIIQVDGKSLIGMSNQDSVEVLKNTGKSVQLKFIRYLSGTKHDQLEHHTEYEETSTPQPAIATSIESESTTQCQLPITTVLSQMDTVPSAKIMTNGYAKPEETKIIQNGYPTEQPISTTKVPDQESLSEDELFDHTDERSQRQALLTQQHIISDDQHGIAKQPIHQHQDRDELEQKTAIFAGEKRQKHGYEDEEVDAYEIVESKPSIEEQNGGADYLAQLYPDPTTLAYARKWMPLLMEQRELFGADIDPENIEIIVTEFDKFKPGGGLGISLEGTVDVQEDGTETHPHHYIRSILPDGPLGLDGKLQGGDELLEVNGIILYGKNHREVVRALKETPLRVRVVCARYKGIDDTLDGTADIPESYIDSSQPTTRLSSNLPGTGIAMREESSVSPPSYFGATLVPNMFDGVSLDRPFTPDELLAAKRYEVPPSYHPESQLSFDSSDKSGFKKGKAPHPEPSHVLPTPKAEGTRMFKAKSESAISFEQPSNMPKSQDEFGALNETGAATLIDTKSRSKSLEPLRGLAVWSHEPLIVDLIKTERGLGFSILDYQDPTDPEHTVIVIRSLVPGGQAQLEGTIEPGDRLLFVNETPMTGLMLDSAVMVLKHAPRGPIRIGICKPIPLEQHTPVAAPKTNIIAHGVGIKDNKIEEFDGKIPFEESNRSQDETLIRTERPLSPFMKPEELFTQQYPLAIEDEHILALEDQKIPSLTAGNIPTLAIPPSPTPKFLTTSQIHTTPQSLSQMEQQSSPTTMISPSPQIPTRKRSRATTGHTSPIINEAELTQQIVIPPLPHALERNIKLRKGLQPLGLTLESEDIGANGCVVSSISMDSPLRKDGRIKVGDYLTSLNNESLRYVTQAQAKSILSRLALVSGDISVNYIPSDDAAIHNQSAILAMQQDNSSNNTPTPSRISDKEISPAVSFANLTSTVGFVDKMMSDLRQNINDSLKNKIIETNLPSVIEDIEKGHPTEIYSEETIAIPSTQQPQNIDLDSLRDKVSSLTPPLSMKEQSQQTIKPNEKLQIEEIEQLPSTNVPSTISKAGSPDTNSQQPDIKTVTHALRPTDLGLGDMKDEQQYVQEDNRWSPPRYVELTKDDNQSYGLSIVGGTIESDLNPDFDKPVAGIFIKNVFPNGPAFKNGQLKTGDRILEINSYKVNNSSLEEAVKIIRESKNSVRFLIQSLMGSDMIPYTFTFTPKKTDTISQLSAVSPVPYMAGPSKSAILTTAATTPPSYVSAETKQSKPSEVSIQPLPKLETTSIPIITNKDFLHPSLSTSAQDFTQISSIYTTPIASTLVSTTINASIAPSQVTRMEEMFQNKSMISVATSPITLMDQPLVFTTTTTSQVLSATCRVDSMVSSVYTSYTPAVTKHLNLTMSKPFHTDILPRTSISSIESPSSTSLSSSTISSFAEKSLISPVKVNYKTVDQLKKEFFSEQQLIDKFHMPSISEQQTTLPQQQYDPNFHIIPLTNQQIHAHSKAFTSHPYLGQPSPYAPQRGRFSLGVSTLPYRSGVGGRLSMGLPSSSTLYHQQPLSQHSLARPQVEVLLGGQPTFKPFTIPKHRRYSDMPPQMGPQDVSQKQSQKLLFKHALSGPVPYHTSIPSSSIPKFQPLVQQQQHSPIFIADVHNVIPTTTCIPPPRRYSKLERVTFDENHGDGDETKTHIVPSTMPIPQELPKIETSLGPVSLAQVLAKEETLIGDDALLQHLPTSNAIHIPLKEEITLDKVITETVEPDGSTSILDELITKEMKHKKGDHTEDFVVEDETKYNLPSTTKEQDISETPTILTSAASSIDKCTEKYSDLSGDILVAELRKNYGKLGISLAGNKDRSKLSVFIAGLHSDDAKSMLKIGDEILEANDHILFGRSHLNASSILHNLSNDIQLTILRRPNATEQMAVKPLKPKDHLINKMQYENQLTINSTSQQHDPTSLTKGGLSSVSVTKKSPMKLQDNFDLLTCNIIPDQPTLIHIEKRGQPLGISLMGGQETLLGSIMIEEIHKDGAAQRDGRLQVNDLILEVNGENLRKVPLEFAKDCIYQAHTHIVLLILRNSLQEKFNREYFEYHTIELTKKQGKSLGISIKDRSTAPRVIITHLLKGSVAELDGRFKIGDQVLEINSQNVENMRQEKIASLLKGLSGKVTFKIRRLKPATASATSESSNAKTPLTEKFLKLKLSSDNLQDKMTHTGKFVLGKPNPETPKEVGNISLIQFIRNENENWGLELAGSGISNQMDAIEPIAIKSVSPTGLASGKLNKGDRLLSVNGQSLENMSLGQANNFLNNLKGPISMEVVKSTSKLSPNA